MIAALRIIIFGHQMSPSPHPAQLVQPAPYRLGRNIQAMFELEGLSQRGAAPAGAAPTIARRSGLEQGEQRHTVVRHATRANNRIVPDAKSPTSALVLKLQYRVGWSQAW